MTSKQALGLFIPIFALKRQESDDFHVVTVDSPRDLGQEGSA